MLCKNSYERRIVHILARGLGLYHARYGDWDCVKFERFFDRQCKCSVNAANVGVMRVKIVSELLALKYQIIQ